VRGARAISSAVVVGLWWLGAATATASAAHATTGDIAVIGSREAPSATSAGNKWLDAGPVAGRPSTAVDAAASTVTVAVDDSASGAKATLTMAWPARPGSWYLDFNGPDPEQTVKMTRGAKDCTFTSGTLTVHRAVATSTGQVAALSVDVTGSCPISNGGYYAGAQVRIGDTEPARVVSVPRATPASISTGALTGTVVTHEVTLTNAGDKQWKVGTAATSSANSWGPTFKVVPESNHCTGLTLATGQTCTLQVTTSATSYTVFEYLLVGGDSAVTLVVPLRLEGYAPVEPPTAATAAPGRLSATVSWQPPSTLPRSQYRIYDVTNGSRSLVATAPTSATEASIPGPGARRLAVVAANGPFAESRDAFVDVPAITSELVGNDWYGFSLSVATDTTDVPARQLTRERVDLDPSRTRWVTAARTDVSVCPVATEECVSVPGTASTADADAPREAAWLPDGSIAFIRGYSSELRTLWVVRPDGSGLRKVASIPERWQLAAAPSGTEVVLRNSRGDTVERVRLSDGRITAIPGTGWVDDFTVSNRGLLVIERRVDLTQTNGPRTTTVMNLDGSSARRLALPAGDNREVTFDPSGTRVAFARYTGDWQATMWVAAADGTGARQLSTASKGWIDLKWSVNDRLAPTASVTVPAYTTRTATPTIGATDGDDAAGSLRRQCRLDKATTWTACGSALTLTGLAAGTHTLAVQVTDPSGKQSAVVTKSWTVDATAPTTSLAAPAAVQTRTPTTLTWNAADTGGSGLVSYDVRARTASASAGLGAYQYPASWQTRTTRSLTLTLSKGFQYCFSVRARDRAGNLGAWSAERCTALPLDDRALTASSGWTRGTSSSYLFSTYSKTVKIGAQLTRSSVRGRRIALVATTCATCGNVDVYHAGVKLGRVSLYSSTTKTRQVNYLPLQTVTRTGTVTVRSTGTRQVIIDGLAVLH
jgi:hypothetical protein